MVARDWRAYWNEAAQVRAADPLSQVGKTVGGMPVPPGTINLVVAAICRHLALTPSDRVLELCCGNGVITAELAGVCGSIHAVDFSEPLIATARQRFARRNIVYQCADVTCLDAALLRQEFDKIVMQEALQHLTPEQTEALFASLAASPSGRAGIYLGSIPDVARLRRFYDTSERYADYLARTANGTEAVGTWWSGADAVALAERHGYKARIVAQHPALHTAHYRFDLVCEAGQRK